MEDDYNCAVLKTNSNVLGLRQTEIDEQTGEEGAHRSGQLLHRTPLDSMSK